MPVPLAKHGALLLDQKRLLICGGMSADYEPLNYLRCLELDKMKWTSKAKMNNARLIFSGFNFSGGYAFAFGGAETG